MDLPVLTLGFSDTSASTYGITMNWLYVYQDQLGQVLGVKNQGKNQTKC